MLTWDQNLGLRNLWCYFQETRCLNHANIAKNQNLGLKACMCSHLDVSQRILVHVAAAGRFSCTPALVYKDSHPQFFRKHFFIISLHIQQQLPAPNTGSFQYTSSTSCQLHQLQVHCKTQSSSTQQFQRTSRSPPRPRCASGKRFTTLAAASIPTRPSSPKSAPTKKMARLAQRKPGPMIPAILASSAKPIRRRNRWPGRYSRKEDVV